MSSPRKRSSQPKTESSTKEADGWERRERLSKTEAERLLDWLEANGFSRREVCIAKDGSFTVRWHR